MAEKLLLLVLAASAALPAQAQPRGGPTQGVYARVQAAQFRSVSDLDTLASYGFDAPLFGLGYARGPLYAEIAYGTASTPAGRVGILDADVGTSSSVTLREARGLRLEAPLVLHLTFRRVQLRDARSLSDFEVTALGLSGGIAGEIVRGRTAFDASLTAGAGLATRNFDGTPGVLYTGTARVGARFPIGERFALTTGYRFRFRQWDLGKGNLGVTRRSDLYDYRALDHSVHLGVLF